MGKTPRTAILFATIFLAAGFISGCDNPTQSTNSSNRNEPSTSQSPVVTPPAPSAGTIIADHSIVDRYDDIPANYLRLVKTMWFNLPGESHSQAYRTGLGLLAAQNSAYATDCTADSATNPAPCASTGAFLRASKWTSFNGQWYVGEGDWFAASSCPSRIEGHLDYYDSGAHPYGISAIGFGWCWDMTRNGPSAGADPVHKTHWFGSTENGPDGDKPWGLDSGDKSATGNSVCMQTYIDITRAYADYCAAKGYGTKVFFTTGPVDDTGERGYQREIKHRYIRDYVNRTSGSILFDYADILSYNDSGTASTASWTDGDGTVHAFPVLHPDFSGDQSGGHINNAGALRLGKAVWWLMARIAGWDGL